MYLVPKNRREKTDNDTLHCFTRFFVPTKFEKNMQIKMASIGLHLPQF